MTVSELITKIKKEKPNCFTDEQLVAFINEIEGDVAEQLRRRVNAYTWENNQNTTLLAKEPYSRLYVSYVKAMIDYSTEEYISYENNQAQHIQDFRDFSDWCIRTGDLGKQAPSRIRW